MSRLLGVVMVSACLAAWPGAHAQAGERVEPGVPDSSGAEGARDASGGREGAAAAGGEAEPAPVDPESRAVFGSLASWLVKKGVKRAAKSHVKAFIKDRIKSKFKHLLKKDAKKYAKEADEILGALDDPWWLTAIGMIPIAGDAFDLARTPPQIRRVLHRVDQLENAVYLKVANRFGWTTLTATTMHVSTIST